MAGKRITRLRQILADAEIRLAESVGSPDEPFARNRLQAITDELDAAEAHRAKYGKRPGEPDVRNTSPSDTKVIFDRRRKAADTAIRLVGKEAVGNPKMTEEDIGVKSGILAAEIAVEGVRKDFAVRSPVEPDPLTETEYANARDIVATVAENGEGGNLLCNGEMHPDRWLAESFPSLAPARRVKCARFLSGMATLAAEKPSEDAPTGCTVIENALKQAGMSYVEFENARLTDSRFDAAQALIAAARKRCIMSRLEETLQNRALFGQVEEIASRYDESVREVRKIDNRLAFDMLKYGHEQYLRQNIKEKAQASAMTLMIAHGTMPSVPTMKKAEVIDVQ